MSAFEIEIDDLAGGPEEVEISASAEEVEELFSVFEEDFRVSSPEEFEFNLKAKVDRSTVLLWGEVGGRFDYRCGRCLTERSVEAESRLDLRILAREEWEETYVGEEEIALAEEDLDTDYYEGHSIDLGQYIIDAIVLDLPQWPHCPDEFREECDTAYEEHVGDDTLDRLEDNSVDLRWWPLRDIDLDGEGDEETNEGEPN